MQEKKLYLLDAFALIYRAYFALSKNPFYNSKGLNTSAIYGFTNTLLDLIGKEKPTHMAVCFDTAAPTERSTTFTEYKANRQEQPEDITKSFPFIRQIIEAFKIPMLEMDGYEADDVIGTLAKDAEKQGFQVYMVTPDKDFGQLVSENIFIYKPSYMGSGAEKLGVPEIKKRWEINDVCQVIDILGLMGDSIDNIPGLPGIGEKTAKKLIQEFGSVENLIDNTDKLKGKLQQNIIDNKDLALLSKNLATIITNVPVTFDEPSFKMEEPDKVKLTELFQELEFRTLGRRIIGETYEVTVVKTQSSLFDTTTTVTTTSVITDIIPEEKKEAARNINNVPHQYYIAATHDDIISLIEKLNTQDAFCFDTESTSKDANEAELVGLSFCWKEGEAYYVPLSEDKEEIKKTLALFQPVLQNKNILKIGQNIKYDLLLLKWYDVEMEGPFYDTMLAHYLIEPDMRHNMDFLAETYLEYKPISITELIGKKGKNQGTMREVEIPKVAEYASEDADITFQLMNYFTPLLKQNGTEKLFQEVETPLTQVLTDMEFEGVAIDKKFLDEYSVLLGTQIQNVEKEVYEIAGVQFNLGSPKQLGEVLFDKMKIPYSGKKTKSGQYSTDEETLSRLALQYDIAKKIQDHREWSKLKSTYVDALPNLIKPRTGRVHTCFNQAVAATGRLSSTNPNLQNIPIRTDRGKEIRKAFIPRNEEYTVLSADYSQIELRIIAAISGDEAMLDAFEKGHDIHAATAAKVYNVELETVSKEMRSNAKMVNFGIVYGISAFGLSQRLGIPRSEAAQLISEYFKQYPGVKRYMDDKIKFAREHGYVETILGRRRYLKDINSKNITVRGFAERNAINAPIQGSAADMIKVAMISIHNEFKKRDLKSKMTLQVHDELVFDAHLSELDIIKPIIHDKMINAVPLNVKMEVGMGTGNNWLDAH